MPLGIQYQSETEDKISDVEFTIADINEDQLSKVGVPFIENQGQGDEKIKFYAKTFAGDVLVTKMIWSIQFLLKQLMANLLHMQ